MKMQNKRFNIRNLIIVLALAVVPFLMPKAQAAYDCNVDYSGGAAINASQLTACCYPAVSEPYGGVSCRPEGTYLQQIGGVVTCTDPSALITKATSQKTLNRKGFNCFTGATPSTCRDNYCPQVGTGTCIPTTGTSCPAAKNRINQCPGACGTCNQDSVYCPTPTSMPQDPGFDVGPDYSGAVACQAKKYGPSTTDPNNANSCKSQGKDVANFCTGECTSCSAGYTESGRNLNACIPFAQRFIEVFQDGLTWLGGQTWWWAGSDQPHTYDYSVTGPSGLSDVNLKSDVAETINWASTSLPPVIKNLITGNGNNSYLLCSASQPCPGAMVCSEGGLCYSTTNSATCTSSSECDLSSGYICDATGHCSIPTGGTNFDGRFVGLTTSTYDGDQGGYPAVNAYCNADFAGSHVCNSAEIIHSYIVGASALSAQTGISWFNSAAPGNIQPAVNDCNGWNDNQGGTDPFYGTAWNFASKNSGILPCFPKFKYACCE